MDINKEVDKISDYIITIRKYFHKYPELSMKEYKTSKKIKEELANRGIPYISAGETGVIGMIGKGEKVIALRADMDALRIREKTEVSYKSVNEGIMHACGHDAHMAALLGAAAILKQHESELKCMVKLIFQPSEENCLGARMICDNGFLADVSSIFGLHVFGDMPCGTISIEEGARMAATDNFRIDVSGKSGHAGKPQQCVDATLVGAAMIMNMQSIISRQLDPNASAVLTIGKLESGTAHNVISGEAHLYGTVRTFQNEYGKIIEQSIFRVVEGTANAYGAKVHIDYQRSLHPAVVNDKKITKIALDSAKKILSENMFVKMPKIFLGEDFSIYQQIIPGTFAFVGAGNELLGRSYPNHHEKFNIDERAVVIAAKLHLAFVAGIE